MLSKSDIYYFYSKTNQMHNISNLFYFGSALYMFRMVFPSVIRSLRLYTQYQANVIQCSANYLLAGSWHKPVLRLPDAVCTILDS